MKKVKGRKDWKFSSKEIISKGYKRERSEDHEDRNDIRSSILNLIAASTNFSSSFHVSLTSVFFISVTSASLLQSFPLLLYISCFSLYCSKENWIDLSVSLPLSWISPKYSLGEVHSSYKNHSLHPSSDKWVVEHPIYSSPFEWAY